MLAFVTPLVEVKVDGTRFYLPENLIACVDKVFAGEYNYTSMPDEPRIRRVLDLGGNVGAFAVWAYKRWNRPWIESYEPFPEAAVVYEKNAPPGAIVKRFAVCAKVATEPAKLLLGADWGQHSLKQGCSVLTGQTIEVPTIHPSGLPECDLLKIDCEGVEPEILENYPHLHKCKIVMFEWHSQDDLFACEAICRREGFTLIRSVLDRADLGLQVWVRTAARYNYSAGRYLAATE